MCAHAGPVQSCSGTVTSFTNPVCTELVKLIGMSPVPGAAGRSTFNRRVLSLSKMSLGSRVRTQRR